MSCTVFCPYNGMLQNHAFADIYKHTYIYIDSAHLSTHQSTVISTFWLLPLFMEPFYNILGLQVATSPLLWNLPASRRYSWIFGNLAVNYRHSICMCFIRITMVGAIVSNLWACRLCGLTSLAQSTC